jgi:membrane-associated protease RseP (regulator of RpoE activity)
MIILGCHEGGHFLQARRYRVRASVPYFLPLPVISIYFGTLGAVIAMDPRVRNRRALFDIGISGPLAGLVPTIIACVVGLQWSELKAPTSGLQLGEPLLFTYLGYLTFGPIPDGQTIFLHPVGFAGWVGLLITALNLIPIGQLDGGHVLYSILGPRARPITLALFLGAVGAAVALGFHQWYLMLFLMALVGPKHPPTADDAAPLGWGRAILGWLTLAFVIVGFTPDPLPGLTGGR